MISNNKLMIFTTLIFGILLSTCHGQGQLVFPASSSSAAASAASSSSAATSSASSSAASAPIPCQTPEGESGTCKPTVQCSLFFLETGSPENLEEDLSKAACLLPGGTQGACCPNIVSNTESAAPASASVPNVAVPDVTLNDFSAAEADAAKVLQERKALEQQLLSENVFVQSGTPSAGHLLFFKTTPETLEQGSKAQEVVEASKGIASRLGFNAIQSGLGLRQFSAVNTALSGRCPPNPRCFNSKYRTADGSCNNLRRPKMGQARTAMQRLVLPSYANGIDSPRIASDGIPLPSPRVVSVTVAPDRRNPDNRHTVNVMAFGQFLDHDLTSAPLNRLSDGSGITCCSDRGEPLPPQLQHPSCFPIEIPPNDPFYAQFGQRCMSFVRSLFAVTHDCNFGFADQMNQLTHWLDGSMIYGTSDQQSAGLREGRGGRLRAGVSPDQQEFLPPQETDDGCTQRNQNQFCFVAGDGRVNEQPTLTVIHTLWLREHNRVAAALSQLNPAWPDEALYQEARRIVVAELQHITYNEWLPAVLGLKYMRQFGLLPLTSGFSQDYMPQVDGSIQNEFAAAAFRLHTLIPESFSLFGGQRRQQGSVQLREVINAPHLLRQTGVFDNMVRGLTTQPMERFDNFITREVTNHLFQGGSPFGIDLVAFNIQRARDHGIASYNEYRELCGTGKARGFQGLADVMSPEAIGALQNIYRSVDDIDLFAGGILERPARGSILGPTFLCIVGDQFARLKKGDRFFYDVGGQPHSFSEAQLKEIRKTSMSRLICDNSRSINRMQPLAFWRPRRNRNPVVACDGPEIPTVDLKFWAGERI